MIFVGKNRSLNYLVTDLAIAFCTKDLVQNRSLNWSRIAKLETYLVTGFINQEFELPLINRSFNWSLIFELEIDLVTDLELQELPSPQINRSLNRSLT